MERLWTIKEVSDRTGVPEATLRWYIHRGTGPRSFKLGGRRVYKPTDVESWIERQYAAASQASVG